jgi:DNA-binding transcriptional MerR regulator
MIFQQSKFASKINAMDVIHHRIPGLQGIIGGKSIRLPKFVVEHQGQPGQATRMKNGWTVTKYAPFLNISSRTLQRLRSKGMISYSLISGKTYYTIGEIKRMLKERRIRSNEEAFQNIINNHQQYVQQRRIARANK